MTAAVRTADLLAALASRGESLAVAESLTGGLLVIGALLFNEFAGQRRRRAALALS